MKLKTGASGLLHHKYCLFDAENAAWHGWTLTGSHNWSASAENNKRVYEVCMDLLGAQGLLYGDYAANDEERPITGNDAVTRAFLRSRANSIEGGTSEVMRNILGERVLGLPGDIRVDREAAWKDVPRN